MYAVFQVTANEKVRLPFNDWANMDEPQLRCECPCTLNLTCVFYAFFLFLSFTPKKCSDCQILAQTSASPCCSIEMFKVSFVGAFCLFLFCVLVQSRIPTGNAKISSEPAAAQDPPGKSEDVLLNNDTQSTAPTSTATAAAAVLSATTAAAAAFVGFSAAWRCMGRTRGNTTNGCRLLAAPLRFSFCLITFIK